MSWVLTIGVGDHNDDSWRAALGDTISDAQWSSVRTKLALLGASAGQIGALIAEAGQRWTNSDHRIVPAAQNAPITQDRFTMALDYI